MTNRAGKADYGRHWRRFRFTDPENIWTGKRHRDQSLQPPNLGRWGNWGQRLRAINHREEVLPALDPWAPVACQPSALSIISANLRLSLKILVQQVWESPWYPEQDSSTCIVSVQISSFFFFFEWLNSEVEIILNSGERDLSPYLFLEESRIIQHCRGTISARYSWSHIPRVEARQSTYKDLPQSL